MKYNFTDSIKRPFLIKHLKNKVYVCVTELKENPGGSTTNNADELFMKTLRGCLEYSASSLIVWSSSGVSTTNVL